MKLWQWRMRRARRRAIRETAVQRDCAIPAMRGVISYLLAVEKYCTCEHTRRCTRDYRRALESQVDAIVEMGEITQEPKRVSYLSGKAANVIDLGRYQQRDAAS